MIKGKIAFYLLATAIVLTIHSCKNNSIANTKFVTVENGRLMRNGKPYRYIGTNLWYAPILASEGTGGDRQRLSKELDALKSMGCLNVRVLAGADGKHGVKWKMEPTLQPQAGVYNDTLLTGLDWMLKELSERDMTAVIYLNNSWDWSGGYGFYLQEAGHGKTEPMNQIGYPAYTERMTYFCKDTLAQRLFANHVKKIVGRTNSYTLQPYTEDPTIMAWQIGNEPRAFSHKMKQPFAKWLRETSTLIKSIDSNHLVSIGSEGTWGCENDPELCEQISSDPNIDYLTIHVWPYVWGWTTKGTLKEDLQSVKQNTYNYIQENISIANKLHKPVVIEEFGFPRDQGEFSRESSTQTRDEYYSYIFSLMDTIPTINAVNFWGWGGNAKPRHLWWQSGDPYVSDPPQEEQGLFCVFDTDSTTINLIKKYNFIYQEK